MGDVQTKIILETIIKGADSAKREIGNLQSSIEKAEGASKTFAAGLAIFAGAAIAGGIKAVTAFQESRKAEAQLNAVLKSTGSVAGMTKDRIIALSKEMQNLTNYDDEAVLGAENLLLTFTNIKNDVFPQATKTVLDMSAALGQDLKSSSIQLGKALQDPILGVSALRRVGVNFSEDQKEVIKKLVETGKVAEAQKLILKELATEFGGSAQAIADPITQMNNAINDAWEAIGQELYPWVTKLAGAVKDFAENILPKWITFTKELVAELNDHKVAIYIVAGAIAGALAPAVYAAVVAFGALAVTLAPFMLAGALIAGITAGVWWVSTNWELAKAKMIGVWDSLKAYLGTTILAWKIMIGDMWESIKTIIAGAKDGVVKAFSDLWEAVKQAIISQITAIEDRIYQMFNTIKNTIRDVKEVMQMSGGNIFAGAGLVGAKASSSLFKAKGGDVNAGEPHVVGEQGPEWFVPNRSGSIIPNNKLGGLNVTVYVEQMIGEEEFAQKMGKQIVKDLAMAVAF